MNTQRYVGCLPLALMAAALVLLMAGVLMVRRALERYLDFTPQSAAQFQVAFVAPRATNDAWVASGYRGARRIAQRLGAQLTLLVAKEDRPDRIAAALSNAALAGADVVIGHGGQFVEPCATVAPLFSKTSFVVIGEYAGNGRNLGAISFRDEETGYLAGCLAALCSRRGRVAYVGGAPLPHMCRKGRAFVKGARSITPDIVATAVYVGSWIDIARACAVGDALCTAGFDVVSVDADTAGLGLQHHLVGRAQRIPWAMQDRMAPAATAGQIVQRPDLLVEYGVAQIWQGQWQGRQYRLGVRDGAHDVMVRAAADTLPCAQRIHQIRDQLRAGDLDVRQ